MTSLDLLILLAAATVLAALVLGRWRGFGVLSVLAYGVQLALLAQAGFDLHAGAGGWTSAFTPEVFGNTLSWTLTGFGWFFAFITVGAALFSAWFSAGEWGRGEPHLRLFHGSLALNVLAMLILLASGDLLSLFIGWELVTWAGFLIMVQKGGPATAAAYRYLIYGFGGGMAVFGALVFLQMDTGSLSYAAVAAALAASGDGTLWLMLLLLGGGFAVKMAMVPTHLWQADAYAEAPGPASAFLGAASGRMSLFALMILLVQLVGFERLQTLTIPFLPLDGQLLWAWLAAITAVVPTFIALTQNDARKLLAWHGIGQGGYMLLGVMVATSMGVAGGLLHALNYAMYQAALFLAVTAVMHRTGSADLDRLGGLITRMPLTYVTMLLGIIGLAGLPPLNGFVSKWLIYKSLLDEGMPLLFLAAVIGTLGTILSVYKLIHNTFLGQLRAEHMHVREVPLSMTVPMLVLGALTFVTGMLPGLALYLVDVAQSAIGVTPLDHHLGGVDTGNGSLDMRWLVGVMLAAMGIGAGIFFLGNRSQPVDQLNNYAGGQFLTAETRYHYSHDFYAGFLRVLRPWLADVVATAERGLVHLSATLASAGEGLFRAAVTPLYLLGVTALVLWVVVA
jgi:NADH-quinone oxidoreductase subunit M